MKQESFGNILIEDENNLTGNNTEFYKPTDILSSNTLNRAIEQIYEEDENSYEVLQNLAKTLWGQKNCGILPDIYEEMDANKIVLSNFFNGSTNYFIRIPTGAFIAKTNDKYSDYYDYLKDENNQYCRDFFIDNDHNSFIIFNRPNINLFERQLADHFNFNLNDEDNDIKVKYEYTEDRKATLASNNPTESEILTYNDDKSTIKRTINYLAVVSKTKYNYNALANGGVATTTTVDSKAIELGNNVFTAVKKFANSYGNFLMKKDDKFSLEEIIQLPNNISNKETEYIIFFNPNTKNPIKEINGKEIAYYSYSKRFGITTVENYNTYITDNKAIKLFSLKLTSTTNGGITIPEIVSGSCSSFLKKIDRTTIDIRNLNVLNTINNLVIERKKTSYNISNAHIQEASGNISIGENTLGYPLNKNNDKDPTLFSQRYKTDIGTYNVAVGNNAMRNTNNPNNNIAIGENSLINIGKGNHNIEIGKGYGYLKDTNYNINIGDNIQSIKRTNVYNNNVTIGKDNFNKENDVVSNNYIFGEANNPTTLGTYNYIIGNKTASFSIGNFNYIFGNENNILLKDSNFIIGNANTGKLNTLKNYIYGFNNLLNNVTSGGYNFIYGEANTAGDKDLRTYIIGVKNNTANVENLFVNGSSNNIIDSNNSNVYGESNDVKKVKNIYILGRNNIKRSADSLGNDIYTIGYGNSILQGDSCFFIGKNNVIDTNPNSLFIIGSGNKQITATDNTYIVGYNNKNVGSTSFIMGYSNNSNYKTNNVVIGNSNEISGNNNIIIGASYKTSENNTLVLRPVSYIKSFSAEQADFFLKVRDNNGVGSNTYNAILNAWNFELDVNNAVFNNDVRIVHELSSIYNISVSSWGGRQSNTYTNISSWNTTNDNMLSVPITGTLTSFADNNLRTIKTFLGSGYNTSASRNEFLFSVRENNGKNSTDKSFKMWLDYTDYDKQSAVNDNDDGSKHLKFTVLGYNNIDYTDYISNKTAKVPNANNIGKFVKTLIDNGPGRQTIEGNLVLRKGLKVNRYLDIIAEAADSTEKTYFKVFDGDAKVKTNAATVINNTLTVAGATTLNNTLTVNNKAHITGATTLDDTLEVKKATTLNNTLTVRKATTLDGILTIAGATTLNNTLTVNNKAHITGATTLDDTLEVKKATTLNNTLTVNNKAHITGATTLNNTLTVADATTLDDTLTVADATTLNGTLTVADKTTLNGDTKINGDTTNIYSVTTIGKSNDTKSLTVYGNTTFTGNFKNTGDGEITKNFTVGTTAEKETDPIYKLTVNGETYLNGKTYIYDNTEIGTSTDNKNLTVNGGLSITGDAGFTNMSLSGTLTVADKTTLNGDTKINGDTVIGEDEEGKHKNLAVNGTLTVADKTTLNGDTKINGDTVIGEDEEGKHKNLAVNGTLTVADKTTLNGDTKINGDTTNIYSVTTIGKSNDTKSLTVYGNTTFTGNFKNTGDGEITGATTLGNTLEVKKATTLDDTLEVKKATTLDGTLTVAGITTLNGTEINSTLSVTETTTLKDAIINNKLRVEDATILKKGLTVIKGSNTFHVFDDQDYISTNAELYATSFVATSAKSKKKNIKDTIHHAVDEINKIKIVDFNFKTDINNENPKVGFIADDTDAIFATNKHNSMDIYNCVGMLLKAVQELSAENKQLKKEIESIK